MKNIVPVIKVVYKSKDGNWRGFCFPYDITCNAISKEDAIKKLTGLVETYEECLGQYNNPKHLMINSLSDKEDSDVFEKIWPIISKKIANKLKTANPTKYSNFLSSQSRISSSNNIISFSHRSLACAENK
ncbi:MAG: hypothetical protein AAB725_02765 [Patescibacteria group bacterium]